MSFLNDSNDKRQQHASKDEYSPKNNTSTSLQVKTTKLPLQPSSITSTQKANTIHKSLVSNTIQQCIHSKELNNRNQLLNENDDNYNTNYSNISTNSLKSNNRVHLNHIYWYSTNNNNSEKNILTTRKIIYTYSCGHKKSMTLQYTPIYSINNNQSSSSHTKFKSTSSFKCLSYKTVLSADEKQIPACANQKIMQQNIEHNFDSDIDWLSIHLDRQKTHAPDMNTFETIIHTLSSPPLPTEKPKIKKQLWGPYNIHK